MRVQLKGINRVSKRLSDGSRVTYFYAWKGGPRLPGKPGDAEFVAAYNAAVTVLQGVTSDSSTVTTALLGIANAVAHNDLTLI